MLEITIRDGLTSCGCVAGALRGGVVVAEGKKSFVGFFWESNQLYDSNEVSIR